jgi:hypothetical protein
MVGILLAPWQAVGMEGEVGEGARALGQPVSPWRGQTTW